LKQIVESVVDLVSMKAVYFDGIIQLQPEGKEIHVKKFKKKGGVPFGL